MCEARKDEAIVALVGNKVDLEANRQVSRLEGEAKAKEFGALVFHETSAKSGYAATDHLREVFI